jgi:general secretion pathway protein G
MDKKAKPRSPSFLFLLTLGVVFWLVLTLMSPGIDSGYHESKLTRARGDLSGFRTALGMFHVDNGFFPSEAEGLRALFVAPKRAVNWHGPYIMDKDYFVDPWHHPYVYKYPNPASPDGFSVISWGPDGKPGGGDDVGLAGR